MSNSVIVIPIEKDELSNITDKKSFVTNLVEENEDKFDPIFHFYLIDNGSLDLDSLSFFDGSFCVSDVELKDNKYPISGNLYINFEIGLDFGEAQEHYHSIDFKIVEDKLILTYEMPSSNYASSVVLM